MLFNFWNRLFEVDFSHVPVNTLGVRLDYEFLDFTESHYKLRPKIWGSKLEDTDQDKNDVFIGIIYNWNY